MLCIWLGKASGEVRHGYAMSSANPSLAISIANCLGLCQSYAYDYSRLGSSHITYAPDALGIWLDWSPKQLAMLIVRLGLQEDWHRQAQPGN
jgi:hypothetical protein